MVEPHGNGALLARGPLLAAWLALALWTAGPLWADRWYEHYERAERALVAERWREAVEELQQALERRGDSGVRVRTYGMNVVDYFPYLKLGIAYHQLGLDDAALEAFATEERLRAIESAPSALEQLREARQRVEQNRQAAIEATRRRSEEALAASLEQARRLRREGRREEAMTALASGLAVAPNDPAANELMAALREEVVAEEERLEKARQRARDLDTARRLLAQSDFEGAARLLRQVLAAGPDAEARRLLDRAQAELVASVAAERRQQQIGEALTAARQLAAREQHGEALDRLELVFALEPDHPEATALRREMVTARERERRDSLLLEHLDAAREHLEAGRFEDALSLANRVLALERGEPRALDVVGRAYRQISLRVLGEGATTNLPPAIRFADRREEVEVEAGVERIERVAEPRFRLTGVAIDSSPVRVEVVDGEGRAVRSEVSSQAVGQTVITEFSARRRLAPGTNVWTVVATDDEGSSSRSEYRILYSRPWFRAPWLPATGAVVVLALGSGWWLRRRRALHRRLRRRFNPYVAGRPIFDHGLFFGREALIQRVLQTIHNNSLLLYGERRIGKTSLLHQLHRRLEELEDPDYDFYPVYIDLQGTPEEKFFATLADPIFDAVRGSFDPDSPLHRRSPALARDEPYTHHHLVRELHLWIKELRSRSEREVKLVLLIDEVDELNHYDPRINQSLRSLFMKRFGESLAAVVAGVGIRREWEKEGSPWYNFFEEIPVSAIDADEARRLIEEPIRGTFRFEPAAVERLVELAGGKPFQIQRRCLALVQRLHEEGRRTVASADVEAVERELAAGGSA